MRLLFLGTASKSTNIQQYKLNRKPKWIWFWIGNIYAQNGSGDISLSTSAASIHNSEDALEDSPKSGWGFLEQNRSIPTSTPTPTPTPPPTPTPEMNARFDVNIMNSRRRMRVISVTLLIGNAVLLYQDITNSIHSSNFGAVVGLRAGGALLAFILFQLLAKKRIFFMRFLGFDLF